MRATVYCESCKQTVWKDYVHSCWDESARAQDQKVRDAERVVLSRAVEFADAHTLFYAGSDDDAEHLDAVEQTLLAAIAALLAAEAAS